MTVAFHFRGAELGLFNQDQSTQEEVMRPLESNDIRECQNPLYGAVTTAEERYTG